MLSQTALCQHRTGGSLRSLPPRSLVAFRPACSCAARQSQWTSSRSTRRAPQICRATAAASTGKLLSKSEVPAFIPRDDLMDQLLRWALMNAQEEGVALFGLPMKVTRQKATDNDIKAFKVTVMSREGATLTDIGLNFDDESSSKYDWLGRGADGFPTTEGEATEVQGKHLEIRQACGQTLLCRPGWLLHIAWKLLALT